MYRSTADLIGHTHAGLAGPLVITRRGGLATSGDRPTDVDRELFLDLQVGGCGWVGGRAGARGGVVPAGGGWPRALLLLQASAANSQKFCNKSSCQSGLPTHRCKLVLNQPLTSTRCRVLLPPGIQ